MEPQFWWEHGSMENKNKLVERKAFVHIFITKHKPTILFQKRKMDCTSCHKHEKKKKHLSQTGIEPTIFCKPVRYSTTEPLGTSGLACQVFLFCLILTTRLTSIFSISITRLEIYHLSYFTIINW